MPDASKQTDKSPEIESAKPAPAPAVPAVEPAKPAPDPAKPAAAAAPTPAVEPAKPTPDAAKPTADTVQPTADTAKPEVNTAKSSVAAPTQAQGSGTSNAPKEQNKFVQLLKKIFTAILKPLTGGSNKSDKEDPEAGDRPADPAKNTDKTKSIWKKILKTILKALKGLGKKKQQQDRSQANTPAEQIAAPTPAKPLTRKGSFADSLTKISEQFKEKEDKEDKPSLEYEGITIPTKALKAGMDHIAQTCGLKNAQDENLKSKQGYLSSIQDQEGNNIANIFNKKSSEGGSTTSGLQLEFPKLAGQKPANGLNDKQNQVAVNFLADLQQKQSAGPSGGSKEIVAKNMNAKQLEGILDGIKNHNEQNPEKQILFKFAMDKPKAGDPKDPKADSNPKKPNADQTNMQELINRHNQYITNLQNPQATQAPRLDVTEKLKTTPKL